MRTSTHAKARMKQRGIATEDINLILEHGDAIPRPGSATEFFIAQDKASALSKGYRKIADALEKVRGKAVLLSADGTIITAYRKT